MWKETKKKESIVPVSNWISKKKKYAQIVQKNILRGQLFEIRAILQFHEGSLKKDCIVYLREFGKAW